MDWQDESFEAFLRQFRPLKPKALPNRRRALLGLVPAAAVLMAFAIPTRIWWTAAPDTPTTLPAASVQPGNATGATPAVQTEGLDVLMLPQPAIVPGADLPTLSSRGRALARPGSSPATARSRAGGAAPRRLRVGGAVKAPVRIINVNPVYPEEAQANGIQGTVILDCVIGVEGSVIETAVLQSIPELDQAAIDAVEQWVYEPTLLNGEPIEVEMTVTINFTLR